MTPRAVLVGPPGAGKTTVGRALASRLGVPFVDTDSEVERLAGTSVSEVFLQDGEARFRELEGLAVQEALDSCQGVVALGGGAVLSSHTRELLRGCTVVFLDVGVTDAAARVGLNRDRPLLLGNPRRQWLDLYTARRPLYDEVATRTVSTDDRTPDSITDELVRILT